MGRNLKLHEAAETVMSYMDESSRKIRMDGTEEEWANVDIHHAPFKTRPTRQRPFA